MTTLNTGSWGSNTSNDINTKKIAILKDYVTHMRAAGFDDNSIRDMLTKTASVTIPNSLPADFGVEGKLNPNFGNMVMENTDKSYMANKVPSVDEYVGMFNRIPNYEEFQNYISGQVPKGHPMTQTGLGTMMKIFQNNLQGYSGPKVGASTEAYNMGIVGMPQEVADQWIPQYNEIKNRETANDAAFKDYEAWAQANPEAGIQPNDSVAQRVQKIVAYHKFLDQQKTDEATAKENKLPNAVSQIANDVSVAFEVSMAQTPEQAQQIASKYGINLTPDEASKAIGKMPTIDDIITNALMYGVTLTQEQAQAIFNSIQSKFMTNQ
jgi:hypothetical protein